MDGRGDGREGYTLAAGSSASNEGLKGSTHSAVDPIESKQLRRCQANTSPLGEQLGSGMWERSSR